MIMFPSLFQRVLYQPTTSFCMPGFPSPKRVEEWRRDCTTDSNVVPVARYIRNTWKYLGPFSQVDLDGNPVPGATASPEEMSEVIYVEDPWYALHREIPFQYDPKHPSVRPLTVLKDTFRVIFLASFGWLAKTVLEVLNHVKVYNIDKAHQLMIGNRGGRGLLTLSNHASMVDEPALQMAFIPYTWMVDTQKLRWALAAKDVCFKNAILSFTFDNLKSLPVSRGGGVEQPEMALAVDRLERGEWVHIFPEGRVFQDHKPHHIKQGVGRLIVDTILNGYPSPVVLVLYHEGMSDAAPVESFFQCQYKVVAKVGQVVVFDDLVHDLQRQGLSKIQMYAEVAKVVEKMFIKEHEVCSMLYNAWDGDPNHSFDPEKIPDDCPEVFEARFFKSPPKLEVPLREHLRSFFSSVLPFRPPK